MHGNPNIKLTRCSLGMGPISLPLLLTSKKSSFSDIWIPSKWFYFVFHMLQETCPMLINVEYIDSVAHLNMGYILISSFRRVLSVVCFLLGNYPASGVYMPTFRNTLFHLNRQVDASRMN